MWGVAIERPNHSSSRSVLEACRFQAFLSVYFFCGVGDGLQAERLSVWAGV
jgi:hypothetical protein